MLKEREPRVDVFHRATYKRRSGAPREGWSGIKGGKRAPSNSVSRERRAFLVSSVASGIRFAGSRGAGALLGAAGCAATPGVLPPVRLTPVQPLSPFVPVCWTPQVRRPPTLDPDTARNPLDTHMGHGSTLTGPHSRLNFPSNYFIPQFWYILFYYIHGNFIFFYTDTSRI